MSGWQGGVLTVPQWASDLEKVIDAAQPAGPVTLLGISQGGAACIQYAIQHPERVARIILYGAYARGALRRGTPLTRQEYQAMVDLARVAWGKDNPTFRQVFTSRFIPGASHEQVQWFNDLCLKTTPARSLPLCSRRAPSWISRHYSVKYARQPSSCTLARTRLYRSRKGASSQPALRERSLSSSTREITFCSRTNRRGDGFARRSAFLHPGETAGDSVFAALSARERQVLALIADGLSNADIGERLKISEKTVRNHASNVFDKLGVWSRAQAIVFARDHGFSG